MLAHNAVLSRRRDKFDVVQKGSREAILKLINGSLSNEECVNGSTASPLEMTLSVIAKDPDDSWEEKAVSLLTTRGCTRHCAPARRGADICKKSP